MNSLGTYTQKFQREYDLQQRVIEHQLTLRPLDENGVRKTDTTSLRQQRIDSPLKKAVSEVACLYFYGGPSQYASMAAEWCRYTVAAIGVAAVGLPLGLGIGSVMKVASYVRQDTKTFADWTILTCQKVSNVFLNRVTQAAFGMFGLYVVRSVVGVIPGVVWGAAALYDVKWTYHAFSKSHPLDSQPVSSVENRDRFYMKNYPKWMEVNYLGPFLDMNGNDLKARMIQPINVIRSRLGF